MKRAVVLLVLSASCMFGCARLRTGLPENTELQAADRLLSEARYEEAAVAYDTVAKESPGTKRGADALFAAALTQAYYANPRKDYAQALQSFDEFLQLYPKSEKAEDARNWRSLLKTVLELKKENERLAGSIEQLKRLDIRHEERRRK